MQDKNTSFYFNCVIIIMIAIFILFHATLRFQMHSYVLRLTVTHLLTPTGTQCNKKVRKRERKTKTVC